jgi:hypothetical protein
MWEFELFANDIETGSNYLKSGDSFQSLPSGYSYRLMNFDFGVRWAPTNIWSIYAESRLGVAESHDPIQTRNNSEFNRALLGSDFILLKGPITLIPDFQVIYPIVPHDSNSNKVETSEGDTEVIGRLLVRMDLKRLRNVGSLGVNYRDGGRAALLLYGIGSEYDFNGWLLGGELKGFSTIVQDQYTTNSGNREFNSSRVNGQSSIFNSVNPSLLSGSVWYHFESVTSDFHLGIGSTIMGTNTAQGIEIFGRWIFRLPGNATKFSKARRSDLERFREDSRDEVDQNMFKKPEPEPEIEVAPEPTPAPRHSPTPTPVPVRKDDSQQKLQKELNQTEQQFEIKLKKAKRP